MGMPKSALLIELRMSLLSLLLLRKYALKSLMLRQNSLILL